MYKTISIVFPVYNEEENIYELYRRVKNTIKDLSYSFEIIFIDNASTDLTVTKLKKIAYKDKTVKIIVNTRNFGYIRSSFYGLLQSSGCAAILLSSDLQDPPELIKEFVKKWRKGFKVVLAVKPSSEEFFLISSIRKFYYNFLRSISETPTIKNATGAGLFDESILNILKKQNLPYPYFRGLLSEIGFPIATVEFFQPKRKYGKSKFNFYSLYDMAMLGITSHSRIPLRFITIFGFLVSLISAALSLIFFTAKILNWDSFQLGIAPLAIGLFFFASLQILFLGILGEYVSSIHTNVRNMPLVIELERVNF
jgi:glycosyltransferase involved in cell wall biosynthesis